MRLPKNNIGIYLPSIVGYADQYLVRQARVIDPRIFLSREPIEISLGIKTHHVGYASSLARSLSSALTSLLRRTGIATGPEPLLSYRIRTAMDELDVVYTMFIGNAQDLIRRRKSSAPFIIVHAGGSDVTTLRSMPRGYRRSFTNTVKASSLVLCGSRYLEDRLLEYIPDAQTHVHYIGVELPAELPENRWQRNGAFRVIAVSRLHPVKGVDASIRAFAQAFGHDEEARLTIVGDGPERQSLVDLAQRLKILHRVRFLGEVPPGRVERELHRSQVFIQHNRRLSSGAAEALGGSILEASAAGLPVVATASGGVPEAVIDGETGLLVEPDDISAMAAGLVQLKSSPETSRQLGDAGRKYVASNHNASVQDRALEELLRGFGRV